MDLNIWKMINHPPSPTLNIERINFPFVPIDLHLERLVKKLCWTNITRESTQLAYDLFKFDKRLEVNFPMSIGPQGSSLCKYRLWGVRFHLLHRQLHWFTFYHSKLQKMDLSRDIFLASTSHIHSFSEQVITLRIWDPVAPPPPTFPPCSTQPAALDTSVSSDILRDIISKKREQRNTPWSPAHLVEIRGGSSTEKTTKNILIGI